MQDIWHTITFSRQILPDMLSPRDRYIWHAIMFSGQVRTDTLILSLILLQGSTPESDALPSMRECSSSMNHSSLFCQAHCSPLCAIAL